MEFLISLSPAHPPKKVEREKKPDNPEKQQGEVGWRRRRKTKKTPVLVAMAGNARGGGVHLELGRTERAWMAEAVAADYVSTR